MTKWISYILFIFVGGLHFYAYGQDAPLRGQSLLDGPETLVLPDQKKEIRKNIKVEPILLIGNVEAFDIDFTPALEAMSIASYEETPYYPVLAGSFGGNLKEWEEKGKAIIQKYNWSKILIQEADAVARTDLVAFEDNYYPYAQLARKLQSQIILLQGGDFANHDILSFASRQDVLLQHYREMSKLTATEFIPLAHLMARLQLKHDIKIVDEKGNITIEGAWAAAAITYMGLSAIRPANPDFSRLYHDLQELIEPFAQIDVEQRFNIIDAAWAEWKSYIQLVQDNE